MPLLRVERILGSLMDTPNSVVRPGDLDADHLDCIILDMDGTLLDLHFDDQVWNHCLPLQYAKKNDLAIQEAATEIKSLMAPIRGTLQWYCFDHWHSLVGIDLLSIENEVFNLVSTRPGAIEFLERLGDANCKLILASNADRRSMTRKLDHTQLSGYFDAIFSSQDFGFAKEATAFWHALQEEINFDPKRTLFVDDNHNVLAAAHQFGIKFLFGIQQPNSKGDTVESEYFHCLSSFEELTL